MGAATVTLLGADGLPLRAPGFVSLDAGVLGAPAKGHLPSLASFWQPTDEFGAARCEGVGAGTMLALRGSTDALRGGSAEAAGPPADGMVIAASVRVGQPIPAFRARIVDWQRRPI